MIPERWWQEESPPVSIRLHPRKHTLFPEFKEKVPWCKTGRYLLERPLFTLDPHFHAGVYYVQEASSMFLTQLAPLFITRKIVRVLDLCAAPGGKSTLLAELLPQDGILVANEVIRSRVAALCENMAKWGYANTVVTNNDAKDFARLPQYFDAVLVDAPCSGEGMFRKDPETMKEWSPKVVALCAERQRRIVADVWETLRPGGYLIYSTCTFNRLENEENVAWICAHLGAETCTVQIDPAWGILEQDGCYRFLPNRIKGEGFFFALLQKHSASTTSLRKPLRMKKASITSTESTSMMWIENGYRCVEKNNLIKAFPTALASEMLGLETLLRVVQSGVAVAHHRGVDSVPDADLALSPVLLPHVFPVAEVDLITARRYLARESLAPQEMPTGYVLIQYQGSRLGFCKNIGSRINNLYPQARRIRMGINECHSK